MKKILIDGRFIGVGDSISRYTLELLSGILRIDQENQYTILIRPKGLHEVQQFFKFEARSTKLETNSKFKIQNSKLIENCKLKIENLHVKVLDIPHYSLAEQTKLLAYLNKEKFDLVHFTQFNHPILYHGNYIVTIHDLTLIGHLHRKSFIKSFAYHTAMKSAIKHSQKIIAISKTTKDELLDYLAVDPKKIEVIHHGIDHERFNIGIKNKELRIKEFKTKYKINNQYILYTGMWKRHKNLLGLLKAFEIFRIKNKESRINLVLVGKVDPNESEVLKEIDRINKSLATSHQLPDAIIATGFISEEELPIAYAGALLYVIPSFAEGFGWPPLEAMACGTPVAASKESCIPEILGDAAAYFDPYNKKEMAETIERIITDTKYRNILVQKGLNQVKKFNWPDCVDKTFHLYQSLLS